MSNQPQFKPDVIIYTDGGCHNTGPRKGDGAWAFVEYQPNTEKVDVYCGASINTTNNRTEMLAIINGIRHYPEGTKILIISDSGYVVKGYNHPSYLDTWLKNGWKTSSGGDVINQDLWLNLIALSYSRGIKFQLIRGHYKDPNPTHALWNSIVDRACTNIIKNNIIDAYAKFEYRFKTKEFVKIEDFIKEEIQFDE